MVDKKNTSLVLRPEKLRNLIYHVRGVEVMLDRDLADLYQVETRALKQAVKRNCPAYYGIVILAICFSFVNITPLTKNRREK